MRPKESGFSRMEITELSAKFSETEALRRISLTVRRGELVALIGRNGGGKTTLLRSVLGYLSSKGGIRFFGTSGEEVFSPAMGYVPQRAPAGLLSPATVYDFAAAALSNYPVFLPGRKSVRKRVLECLERTGIAGLSDRPFHALSGGEAQKLLFAIAVSPVPELLLLDEPAAAMDAHGSEMLYAALLKLKTEARTATLLASHDIPAALKVADRVVLIDQSIVFDLPPKEAAATAEFRQRFGTPELLEGGGGAD